MTARSKQEQLRRLCYLLGGRFFRLSDCWFTQAFNLMTYSVSTLLVRGCMVHMMPNPTGTTVWICIFIEFSHLVGIVRDSSNLHVTGSFALLLDSESGEVTVFFIVIIIELVGLDRTFSDEIVEDHVARESPHCRIFSLHTRWWEEVSILTLFLFQNMSSRRK